MIPWLSALPSLKTIELSLIVPLRLTPRFGALLSMTRGVSNVGSACPLRILGPASGSDVPRSNGNVSKSPSIVPKILTTVLAQSFSALSFIRGVIGSAL